MDQAQRGSRLSADGRQGRPHARAHYDDDLLAGLSEDRRPHMKPRHHLYLDDELTAPDWKHWRPSPARPSRRSSPMRCALSRQARRPRHRRGAQNPPRPAVARECDRIRARSRGAAGKPGAVHPAPPHRHRAAAPSPIRRRRAVGAGPLPEIHRSGWPPDRRRQTLAAAQRRQRHDGRPTRKPRTPPRHAAHRHGAGHRRSACRSRWSSK